MALKKKKATPNTTTKEVETQLPKTKEEKPVTHAKVVTKKGRQETTVKDETPKEHSVKHNVNNTQSPRVVGMSVGVTRNMGDYESLRIDVWCSDEVKNTETYEEAYDRISALVVGRLEQEVDAIIE